MRDENLKARKVSFWLKDRVRGRAFEIGLNSRLAVTSRIASDENWEHTALPKFFG